MRQKRRFDYFPDGFQITFLIRDADDYWESVSADYSCNHSDEGASHAHWAADRQAA